MIPPSSQKLDLGVAGMAWICERPTALYCEDKIHVFEKKDTGMRPGPYFTSVDKYRR